MKTQNGGKFRGSERASVRTTLYTRERPVKGKPPTVYRRSIKGALCNKVRHVSVYRIIIALKSDSSTWKIFTTAPLRYRGERVVNSRARARASKRQPHCRAPHAELKHVTRVPNGNAPSYGVEFNLIVISPRAHA